MSARKLATAAVHGAVKDLDALLGKGVDIDAKIDGRPALHAAIGNASLAGVRFLLDRGADVDAIWDGYDMTPLMAACSQGKSKGSKIALMLITAGCDVAYRRAEDEMSALEFAVAACTSEVVEALIAAGAPVNGPDGCQQTPAILAIRANNVDNLKALMARGADLTIRSKLTWAKGADNLELARMEGARKAATFLEQQVAVGSLAL